MFSYTSAGERNQGRNLINAEHVTFGEVKFRAGRYWGKIFLNNNNCNEKKRESIDIVKSHFISAFHKKKIYFSTCRKLSLLCNSNKGSENTGPYYRPSNKWQTVTKIYMDIVKKIERKYSVLKNYFNVKSTGMRPWTSSAGAIKSYLFKM